MPVSFLKSQVAQIRKGGTAVFYKKIKKFFWLIQMELLASLAVDLGVHWPEAYLFIAYKNFRKYKDLRLTYKSDVRHVHEVQQKTIDCLEKYAFFDLELSKVREWIDANSCLIDMLLTIPKIENLDKARQVANRVEQLIQNIPVKYKMPETDIAFIPREFAVGSIGTLENLEKYLKVMAFGLVPARKLFLLVGPQTIVHNQCYLNYWGKHVTVVTKEEEIRKLEPQEQYLSVPIGSLFKLPSKEWLPYLITLGEVREQWIRQKRPPILKLFQGDLQRGWDCLMARGVPKGAWFVGLHVRGSGWRDSNSEIQGLRNADIRTYFTAIKSITDAGGWVVRLGDSASMSPLPAMDHVIDYAHSDLKNDWMDVFLTSQCRFFIGTCSGPCTLALAFGVPCVMTNITPPFNIFAFTSQDIILMKLCRSKSENRYLTFQELLDPPFAVSFLSYNDMGIEVVDNTSDEIKGAVEEMLARCDGTLKYSQEDEDFQADFNFVVKDLAPLYGDKDIECYSRLGAEFLRKHASLLPARKV